MSVLLPSVVIPGQTLPGWITVLTPPFIPRRSISVAYLGDWNAPGPRSTLVNLGKASLDLFLVSHVHFEACFTLENTDHSFSSFVAPISRESSLSHCSSLRAPTNSSFFVRSLQGVPLLFLARARSPLLLRTRLDRDTKVRDRLCFLELIFLLFLVQEGFRGHGASRKSGIDWSRRLGTHAREIAARARSFGAEQAENKATNARANGRYRHRDQIGWKEGEQCSCQKSVRYYLGVKKAI